jgi:hypothetical protein
VTSKSSVKDLLAKFSLAKTSALKHEVGPGITALFVRNVKDDRPLASVRELDGDRRPSAIFDRVTG